MAAWSLVTVAPDLGKSGKTNNGGSRQSIFLTFISKVQEAIGETMNYLSEPRERKPFRLLNNAIPLCGERLCPVLQQSWGTRGQRPELFSPCRFISHTVEMAAKLMMLRHEHRKHHAELVTGTPSFNRQVLHQHHPNYTVKNTKTRWRDGLVVKSIRSQLLSLFPSTHMGWLTTISNSSSGESDVFFWFLFIPAHMWCTDRYTYNHSHTHI